MRGFEKCTAWHLALSQGPRTMPHSPQGFLCLALSYGLLACRGAWDVVLAPTRDQPAGIRDSGALPAAGAQCQARHRGVRKLQILLCISEAS